jgi:hypothetical protein
MPLAAEYTDLAGGERRECAACAGQGHCVRRGEPDGRQRLVLRERQRQHIVHCIEAVDAAVGQFADLDRTQAGQQRAAVPQDGVIGSGDPDPGRCTILRDVEPQDIVGRVDPIDSLGGECHEVRGRERRQGSAGGGQCDGVHGRQRHRTQRLVLHQRQGEHVVARVQHVDASAGERPDLVDRQPRQHDARVPQDQLMRSSERRAVQGVVLGKAQVQHAHGLDGVDAMGGQIRDLGRRER